MTELLASLVLAVTGAPVEMSCGPLPLTTKADPILRSALGMTAPASPVYPTTRMWILSNICQKAARGDRFGLWVIAHESLHAMHPTATEKWVEDRDDGFARFVKRLWTRMTHQRTLAE